MSKIFVNCVYGSQNVEHINSVLVPALADSTSEILILNTFNYAPDSTGLVNNRSSNRIEIKNIKNEQLSTTGFAQSHNILSKHCDGDFFIIINPDCIPQRGSIDRLIETFFESPSKIGIVEGRQWPFEHPKEYEINSRQTPWASGAFALINARQYKALGGMDERYFLYNEDVDLSWRMRLAGMDILYERRAVVSHFTGGRFYRKDLVENEKYFSVRNFLLLMRKFFGVGGERKARSMLLKNINDKEVLRIALADIDNNFANFSHEKFPGIEGNKYIKVMGVNRFHELRE
jgi:GT2 family glycosyltransferase